MTIIIAVFSAIAEFRVNFKPNVLACGVESAFVLSAKTWIIWG